MTSPEVLISRAVEQFQGGELDAAISDCETVLKTNPDHVDALHLLGVVLFKSGNANDAADNLRKALKLDAANIEIERNLGFALRDLKDFEGAANAFESVLGQAPTDVVAAFQLAIARGEMGQLDEAASLFAQIADSNPSNGMAWFNYANARSQAGHMNDALKGYSKAANTMPKEMKVFRGWGMALHSLERFGDAIEKYQRALEIGGGAFENEITSNIGHCLRFQGQFAEAESIYDKVLTSSPEYVEAISGIAAVRRESGDNEEAAALVRPLLEKRPPVVNALSIFGQLAKGIGEVEFAIANIEAAIPAPSLRHNQRQLLHYSAANLHDQAGNYDDAFAHFEKANGMYVTKFDIGAALDRFQNLIDLFDPARMDSLSRADAGSQRPIFIVGMPRSGTTLIEQILASHRDVAGGGELYALPDVLGAMPTKLGCDTDIASVAANLDQETLNDAAHRYLSALDQIDTEAARVTDKLPHNFEHLWLIRLLFPDAAVLHCRRDPLDTCLSCFFQNFGERHPYSRDLAGLGRHYGAYLGLMRHWEAVLSPPMLEIPYEEVVADAETWARRIVDFCGLDWDPNCLKFYENRRFIQTASHDQVREPIYTHSVARHTRYQAHLEPLKKALEEAEI